MFFVVLGIEPKTSYSLSKFVIYFCINVTETTLERRNILAHSSFQSIQFRHAEMAQYMEVHVQGTERAARAGGFGVD